MKKKISSKKDQNSKQNILDKKAFLFDLDGTLYLGGKLLPGAVALISRLRKSGKKLIFFTNNSSRSESEYFKKLKKLKLASRPSEIVMSSRVLITYLLRRHWRRIYLLGTPAMEKMLKKSGIHSIHKKPNRRPQVVVVGFDKTLTYEKLLHSCRWIHRGVPFVVTHPDLFCPTDEGPEPDCGAMAKLLELSSGRKADIVLGKPHPSMILEAMSRLPGISKDEIVLFGDRLSTDILMGRAVKIETVLVLTGETTKSMLKEVPRANRPTYVLSSLKELL